MGHGHAGERVPGPGVDVHRELVAARAAGHEETGLLAQQRGDPRFKGVDAGIVAVAVVPNLRGGHGGAHGLGGLGHGVAAEIDGAAGAHGATVPRPLGT